MDGGAGDAELRRDLGHRVAAPAVLALLVVHVLGDLGLAGGELGLLAARAAPGPNRLEPVAGALGHEGVLELGDGADYPGNAYLSHQGQRKRRWMEGCRPR